MKILFPVFLSLAGVGTTSSSTDFAPAPEAVSSQHIEIAGREYRFPADAFVERFRNDKGEEYAVSVGLYHQFWMSVLSPVAKVSGWIAIDNGLTRPVYISRPDDLFQFASNVKAPLPAVRGPVSLVRKGDAMHIWESHDPEIAIEGLVYVTFASRPDMYVQCTQRDLGDWARSCTIFWNDSGALHHFAIAGDWVERAPKVLASYQAAIEIFHKTNVR